ncbi:MAG: ABC transporter permease [Gemmatimonadaceae bacterium]|nr:ABC transporter permease [Gemmatimonadaceae bacterium]
MRKLVVVFKREYLERVRSKWFLVGTLLGPVFFAMITVVPILISSRSKASTDLANVTIIDATSSGMGERVAGALRQRFPLSPAPKVVPVDATSIPLEEDRAVISVRDKETRGYLVLDSNTVSGNSVRYAGRNASSLNDVEQITSLVRQQVLAQRLQGEGIDATRVAALTGVRLQMVTEKIGDNGREKGSGIGNVIFGYVIALLLYMMIVIYGQTILRGVMEEKTTRVAEVVVSSVSTDTLLAGKVLGVGMVAITQVVAWAALSFSLMFYAVPLLEKKLGAGAIASGAASGGPGGAGMASQLAGALPSLSMSTLLALLLFFVLGFIFYASLFAAIGAMVNSQEDVQQASMPVMLLLVSSVVFMTPIMTNPGSGLARTMSLLPFSAPILMPLRMTLIPVPWYEVAGSIAGVAIACLAAIWISARVYRVGLLMYGKKPSFREVARWVRYAG